MSTLPCLCREFSLSPIASSASAPGVKSASNIYATNATLLHTITLPGWALRLQLQDHQYLLTDWRIKVRRTQPSVAHRLVCVLITFRQNTIQMRSLMTSDRDPRLKLNTAYFRHSPLSMLLPWCLRFPRGIALPGTVPRPPAHGLDFSPNGER
ncbi:hypothetical protein BDW22DRAFT_1361536 [Trametopsis cervina]|nr:hypothetical protein BDW22DRAFT_1361536 [Trametopsis cervina]